MKSWASLVLAAALIIPVTSRAAVELPDLLSKIELEQEFSAFPEEQYPVGLKTSERLKILIQKSSTNETMTISLDDAVLYTWPMSTGRNQWETTPSGSYELTETPNGIFRVTRMVRNYVSRTWKAKMPYAIFFNRGVAIHATANVEELGTPASGGCVRVETSNAKTLWNLVASIGTSNTVIVVENLDPTPEPTPTPEPK